MVNVSSIVSSSKESERQMKFSSTLNLQRSQQGFKRSVNETKVLFSEIFRNKNFCSGRRDVVGISC